MKIAKLIILSVILLMQFALAENYANYYDANLNIKLDSEIDIKTTGQNPRLIELSGILNLIPLDTNGQDVLNMKIYSEPEALTEKLDNKIIYNWKNIKESRIFYGVESEVKTQNTPLVIKHKINYPTKFKSKYDVYTKDEDHININNEIENLADELFSGETDLFHAVYKTASWVGENIEHKKTLETENKVKKSSWVLKNKYGLCDELTNLFISLLRSKNIPARFISGVVYSNSKQKFENHGWAEVYFPDYGWLPFDLTYQQYGWLDVTHIKLSEASDSGGSSIDYSWKSSDLEVDINKLDINADFKKLGSKMLPILTSGIEPVKAKVNFNSYVPIRVTLENPTSYYISPVIYLSKAPPVEGKNKKTTFLKPKEIKSVYFIVKIPENLDKNYIFKSELEMQASFSEPASSVIEFSSDYPLITKEEAESIILKYTAKETKQEFRNINFDCTTQETAYYENENIEVICILRNKENNIKDLSVCITEDCKGTSLKELEEKILIFKTKATGKIIATAEDENKIKYSSISLDIIRIPNIAVKSIDPLTIDYNEEVDLKIETETIIPAYNVTIYIGKQIILNTTVLHGKREITTKVKGKNLINNIKLKITYKDKLNKEYSETEEYLVTIKNRPWYTWLISWL